MKTRFLLSIACIATVLTASFVATPQLASAQTLGGGMARNQIFSAPAPQVQAQAPAPAQNHARLQDDISGLSENDYSFEDAATQSRQEYRGYNGRTAEQAFYRCKYESFRAATPGDTGKGILTKLRMRMYVMDVCMNSEGFFREKRRTGIPDFSLVSSGDFFF